MTATLSYDQFLANKVRFDEAFGIDIPADAVNPMLKAHQAAAVRWAVKGGRRGLFESFGLGKTMQQLEVLRLILEHDPDAHRALIVMPLGVRPEFFHDARMLGITVRFVRASREVNRPGIYLTNYESVRDGKLDPNLFDAVSLDEAAVLRSYGSKTFQTFLPLFKSARYRFVATATPSPNRKKELIHYAGFLGVMDTGEALTRWFKRNSKQANDLQIHPHKEREFWLWVNTWGLFLQSPADLGFDSTGYDLPKLDLHWHEVAAELAADTADRDGQAHLFKEQALGLPGAAREKRESLAARLAKLDQIIDTFTPPVPDANGRLVDQVVIWCDLNDEQSAIEKLLTRKGLTFSSIHGGLKTEQAEDLMADWRDRRTYALIGKPVMLGSGVNLQQANKAVFIGVSYKFADTIQAVHRTQRFGQTRTCHIHFIHAATETHVVRTLQQKWAEHEELTSTMTDIIRQHGLNTESIAAELRRSIGVERIEASGEGWLVARNDCVAETKLIPDDSLGMVLSSVPFGDHYEYSAAVEDFGHTDGNGHFWQQMDFLTPELLRALKPGRIAAIHVKDRIRFGSVTGAGLPTVSPFHAEAIAHFTGHGFDYIGMHIITTDVVRENNQTYRLGFTKMGRDSTVMGAGSPEFLLLFHKPQSDRSKGWADDRVIKTDEDGYSLARWQVDAHAYWRDSGDRLLSTDELASLPPDQMSRFFTEQTRRAVYDYDAHVRIGEDLEGRGRLPATFMSLAPASWHGSVWTDVNRLETLNTEQALARRENHICPLQFGIVDRAMRLYTNPDDEVYDPFGGLMTVPLRAVKMGRRGRAAELNGDYFLDGVAYLRAEERKQDMPSLFDLIGDDLGATA